MKYAAIFAGVAVGFVVGFECGGNFIQSNIQKTLLAKSELITSALADVFTEAIDKNLSHDEITKRLNQELAFLEIVSP